MEDKYPNQTTNYRENGYRQSNQWRYSQGRGRGGYRGGGNRGGGRSGGRGGRFQWNARGNREPRKNGEGTGRNVTPTKPLSQGWSEVVRGGTTHVSITPAPFQLFSEKEEEAKEVNKEVKEEGQAWKLPTPKRTGRQEEKKQNNETGREVQSNRYELLSDGEEEEVEEVKDGGTTSEKKEEKLNKQQKKHRDSNQNGISKRSENTKKEVKEPKKSDSTVKGKAIKWEENPQVQQQGGNKPVETATKQRDVAKPNNNGSKKYTKDEVRINRMYQVANELAEKGIMSADAIYPYMKGNKKTGLLVSMATQFVLKRSGTYDPEDKETVGNMFQSISPVSEEGLLEIINDKGEYPSAKYYLERMEQQQKTGTIGYDTDLMCMETLKALMKRDRIEGAELDGVIGHWVQRMFRGAMNVREMIRSRYWTGEEVRRIMTCEADDIWQKAGIHLEIAPMSYNREEDVRHSTAQIEQQATKLLAVPLNRERDGKYSVHIVNAYGKVSLSKKPVPAIARGIQKWSAGAVMIFGEKSTLREAIMKGTYVEEGKEGKPSPIQYVDEVENSAKTYDLILRSDDQDELKKVAAYLLRALPLLSNTATAYPRMEYNRTLLIQEESREAKKKVHEWFDMEEVPANLTLRKKVLSPSALDSVLGEMRCGDVESQRIRSHLIGSTTQEIYQTMHQPSTKLKEKGEWFTGHKPQYKYGGRASTKSNVLTRYNMMVENRRNFDQLEEVVYRAMVSLEHVLEQDGQVCEFPGSPRQGEIPDRSEEEAIRKMSRPVLDQEGNWISFTLTVLTSYKHPQRLQDKFNNGLSSPQRWLAWVYDTQVRVKWEDAISTLKRTAMIVYTTELTLSNRDEAMVEIDKIWRGNGDIIPPVFQIDMEKVTVDNQWTNVIVIYTPAQSRPVLSKLIENFDRMEDQMTISTNPSLFGTKIVPFETEEGDKIELREVIAQQNKYLEDTVRVSITGIEAKANLDKVKPRETGMWKLESGKENRLSVRQLCLTRVVRLGNGEEMQSPVLRCGRTPDNRWTLEGHREYAEELHQFGEVMVNRHLPQYMEGVVNIRSMTLHSAHGPKIDGNKGLNETRVTAKEQVPPQPQQEMLKPQGEAPRFEGHQADESAEEKPMHSEETIKAIELDVEKLETQSKEHHLQTSTTLQRIEKTMAQNEGSTKNYQELKEIRKESTKMSESLANIQQQLIEIRADQKKMKEDSLASKEEAKEAEKRKGESDSQQAAEIRDLKETLKQFMAAQVTSLLKDSSTELGRAIEERMATQYVELRRDVVQANDTLYQSIFKLLVSEEEKEEGGEKQEESQKGEGLDEQTEEVYNNRL